MDRSHHVRGEGFDRLGIGPTDERLSRKVHHDARFRIAENGIDLGDIADIANAMVEVSGQPCDLEELLGSFRSQ